MFKFKIHTVNNTKTAELVSADSLIKCVQDALDLMADAGEFEAGKIMIYENQISSEFFDLKTRLAGEMLQKFTNYNVGLAIIGDFEEIKSKSLRDFIYESNLTGKFIFVSSLEDALNRLAL